MAISPITESDTPAEDMKSMDFMVEPAEEMSIVAVVLARSPQGAIRVISAHRTLDGASQQANIARQRYEDVMIMAAVLAD